MTTEIQLAIDSLPVLSHLEIASLADETCPICLLPFSLRQPVTKLLGCGHVFCTEDLTEWIRGYHGTCPTCRREFLSVRPPSESDDESSDGGEYVPPSDDFEDEDDGFLDTDGFTDADAEDIAGDVLEPSSDNWDDDVAVMDDLCDEIDDDFGDDIEIDGDSTSMSEEIDTIPGEELPHETKRQH